MEIYLIKMVVAHLLGDFFFQPNGWVKDKERKKLRSGKLYLHVLVHVALIFMVFLTFSVWKVALSIGVLHLLIDAAKLSFQHRKNTRILFFADQVLHFSSIILIWHLFYGGHLNVQFFNESGTWILISGMLFLSMPASVIIKVIIDKWLPDDESESPKSLQNAGKYIGILERVLIFVFILTSHFEAVGFLLAAKSIFRFGDLKEAHDLKLTEYVLIGTLLSFGIAILTGLFIQVLVS